MPQQFCVAAIVALVVLGITNLPVVAADDVAWDPVPLVALEPDHPENVQGQIISLLRDFNVSDATSMGTLDRFVIFLNSYGRIAREHSTDSPAGLDRKPEKSMSNYSGMKKPFSRAAEWQQLKEALRSSSGKPGRGDRFADFLRLNGMSLLAEETSKTAHLIGGLSIFNFIDLQEFLSETSDEFFTNLSEIRFSLGVDTDSSLWDRMSVRLAEENGRSLRTLYQPVTHIPFGEMSVAVVPVSLPSLTPTLVKHLRFPSLDDATRSSLPGSVKLPVGLILARDLCPLCLSGGNQPALPLPPGAWSRALRDSALGALPGHTTSIFVVGIMYQTVQVDWN